MLFSIKLVLACVRLVHVAQDPTLASGRRHTPDRFVHCLLKIACYILLKSDFLIEVTITTHVTSTT